MAANPGLSPHGGCPRYLRCEPSTIQDSPGFADIVL